MNLPKGTHEVFFKGDPPQRALFLLNGKVWIDRELNGRYKKISFNTIYPGDFTTENQIEKIVSTPLKIQRCTITLPPPERNYNKKTVIRYNPELAPTPARIFSAAVPDAIIEVGPKFLTFDPQIRYFILLHEEGHLKYEQEHYADLYALKKYLERGLNASQAFNALHKVLHPSGASNYRVAHIFKQLKQNNYVGC